MKGVRLGAVLALVWALTVGADVRAAAVLFDASKREMAGNADWVVDSDLHDLVLPAYPCSGNTSESNPPAVPTPPASGVTPATSETYWTGAVSSWALDLVRAGHSVETLPPGGSITFGDAGNPQDLSRFQLAIFVEPQAPFTPSEKTAILSWVAAGGALFMVADHETSDRDCDGWDSPHVWNDLTGAVSAADAGAFGIWFRVDGADARPSEDWFDDAVDANVSGDPGDPVIHGPFGSGAGGLGLFGSTSMDLNAADNPTVGAHVWRTGQPQNDRRVTFATASYGSGRVAAIGDSSPADDGTGDPSDSLHPGWDKASGGVSNREIHLNACAWLLGGTPDTTPPAIVSGPAVATGDCAATATWTTDEPASSSVDYGPTPAYGATASAPGLRLIHEVPLAGLAPATAHRYRVASADAPGNGPTTSADAGFTTAAAAPPVILSGPTASATTGYTASIAWTTDEAADSTVEYGPTTAYGSSVSSPERVTSHAVVLGGLEPLTAYHVRVGSRDGCGNGPTLSADFELVTGPASLDLSGWRLEQSGSSRSFTFPAGTSIPSGGYLVVARDAARSEFEAVFPAMPAVTVFLDSNASGSCADGCLPQVNGGETFELYDAASVRRDGPTIAMSENNAYRRRNPGDAAGSAASWAVVPETSADPGAGAGTPTGAGVVVNEMADAADFRKEFVEVYYDAGTPQPDTVAPAPVSDPVATPVSDSGIRLTWTATGDDGALGTAAAYDVRRSAGRIRTAADFAAATPVGGAPAPAPSGSPEQLVANGLAPGTPYFFAIAVRDEAGNASPLSPDAWATTGPVGSGSPVSHLVISQLRVSGSGDDVIEIYNPASASVSLAGHSIQYLAANGNFGFRVNLSPPGTVPAHGWYLVAANGYAGSPARDFSLGTNNLSATAGHALLVSATTNVIGCSDAAIVDRVGYGGTATCPEGGAGHATASPGVGTSVVRKPGGSAGNGQDTDVNDADFLPPATQAFHDASSSPAAPPTPLGNVGPTLFLDRGPAGTVLRWGAALGATGYRVYRGTTGGFMGGGPTPWDTPLPTSSVDPQVPAGLFLYVVRASDGASESAD